MHLQGPNVPAGKPHVLRHLRHQEHRLLLRIKPPPLHCRDELLRLRLLRELRREVLHHDGAGGGACDGGGDGEALLLAVDLDRPVAGLRAEDDASAGAEGRAVGATAGAAGLLLWEGLAAAAADLAAGEGGGGAAALVLEVGDDGAVDDGSGGVGRGGAEVEEGLADPLAGEVEDGKRRGGLAGNGEGFFGG